MRGAASLDAGARGRQARGRQEHPAQVPTGAIGRRPHLPLPQFWSGQFGVNIKGCGVCSFGDEIVFTQGSVEDLAQGPGGAAER